MELVLSLGSGDQTLVTWLVSGYSVFPAEQLPHPETLEVLFESRSDGDELVLVA